MTNAHVEILGRSSSLFTRIALIVAVELDVAVSLVVIRDLATLDPAAYGGHPALKLPALRRADGSILVGTENICRAIASLAGASSRIVWPEELTSDLSRNAQELVEHALAAQVQLVVGTIVAKLPADNLFFAKGRAGFEGALRWLDDNLGAVLAALPPDRAASLFEIELYCLVDHLTFRETLSPAPYPALAAFARTFATRPSAACTPYRFDA